MILYNILLLQVGAAISTLFSGFVIDIVGRKLTLLILGVPFIGGWLLIAFAQNVGMMMGGRFITGYVYVVIYLCLNGQYFYSV